MRSAIKQIVNAFVRSSLRRSVEQMLVYQRRHTFDSRLDLRVTWREVNANTTADQAFAPVGYIAHAEIRDEDKPPLQSGSIATGRGGRML